MRNDYDNEPLSGEKKRKRGRHDSDIVKWILAVVLVPILVACIGAAAIIITGNGDVFVDITTTIFGETDSKNGQSESIDQTLIALEFTQTALASTPDNPAPTLLLTYTPYPTYTSYPTLSAVPTYTPLSTYTQVPKPTETLIPTATPTLTTQILFEDNFDTGISPVWQIQRGNPVVSNYMLTSDGESWLTVGEAAWEDYTIEFDADAADCWFSWSSNVIAVRFVDLDNMIAFRWSDCESAWYIVENGNWNAVPNVGGRNFGPGYNLLHFTIKAQGDEFSVRVGGERLSSFFSSKFQQGKVALKLETGSTVDNFIITQINP